MAMAFQQNLRRILNSLGIKFGPVSKQSLIDNGSSTDLAAQPAKYSTHSH